MDFQRSLRKCARHSDLKRNFILFDSSSNTLPNDDSELTKFRSTFTLDVGQSDSTTSLARTDRKSLLRDLGLPTICVILPLTLLSAALIGLVIYGRERIHQDTSFQTGSPNVAARSAFILLNVSNSWLLSLSSVSSTLAGLMTPVVMMIQMYLNAQTMQTESTTTEESRGVSMGLPTPYQLSLMLGLGSGSPERLWRFERYRRATWNEIPPMLRRTALVLKLSLLLSLAMFVADQCLHFTTTTVQISQTAEVEKPSAFGRGLNQECLSLPREINGWYPCSAYDFNLSTFQYAELQNQIFFLQHDISKFSSIDLFEVEDDQKTEMAMVLAQNVPRNVDFRASTIGVSARCTPITSQCVMGSGGPDRSYTTFNCSTNFWGTLNKPLSTSTNISVVDSSVPPLSFKWTKNLQVGFFEDSALSIPYNSLGLNPLTGLNDPNRPGLSNSALINPVYFGIAGTFPNATQLAGVDLSGDSGLWYSNDYLSFVLSCSYQTFEVNYTSFNGALEDLHIVPTPNGSIAEIYHGQVATSFIAGADTPLQEILETAALQPSGQALADTWAKLYSKEILSVIGAFTSSRENIQEQSRDSVLVTKLPVPALAVLLALNMAYLPLGLCLSRIAYRQASWMDIRDLFARLSVPGVVTSFFSNDEGSSSLKGHRSQGFDECNIVQEATQIEATLDAREQYCLKPAWHGV